MRLGIDLRCLAEGEAGGIALYTRELLQRLPAHLPEAQLTGLLTGMRAPNVDVAFPVHRLRVPNKLLNASLVSLRWPPLDRSIAAEVFFAPSLKYMALQPATKFVLTLHDLSFVQHPEYFTPRQRMWHHWLPLKRLLTRADAIIAVSQHTADDLTRLYPHLRERTHVIHSGSDHVPTSPQPPLPNLPAQYHFAFAPREARKNIAALRQAQARTARRLPLVLVGSGAGASTADIITLPYLSAADRWRALANAAAFIYPSVYEGFGLPPLEAMRLGVPVIAGQVTSIPEVCGRAALLVDPWDPADLQRAMDVVTTDEAVRQQLITAGRTQAQQYTWAATAEQTVRVLRSVYARRH